MTTGTGFIFNVGGDIVAIGLLDSSASSTSQLQKRKSPRYLILTVPGSWVSLRTASHSRMAARFNSSRVAVRPRASSPREERDCLSVQPEGVGAAAFGSEMP